MTRTVAWFSAGAASAVATKLALGDDPQTVIAYTDPGSEHADNARFITDCETWFGRPVIRLKSSRYSDTWDVWTKRRYLIGHQGTLCTVELKKRLRQQFEQPGDRRANPDVDLWCPLVDAGLTKDDCLALVARAGIELPAMYRLGYRNANCVGCPHGGLGYWNKIRRDFPDVFDRMARMERDLGHSCIKDADGPVWLDELDPNRGDMGDDPELGECSLLCSLVEDEVLS